MTTIMRGSTLDQINEIVADFSSEHFYEPDIGIDQRPLRSELDVMVYNIDHEMIKVVITRKSDGKILLEASVLNQ